MSSSGIAARKSEDFAGRLETVRSMMQNLLKDAIEAYHPLKIDLEKGIDYFEAVDRYETELILTALELAGGRQKDAAKLLNLPSSTLSVKMKRFNIRQDRSRPNLLKVDEKACLRKTGCPDSI